MHFLEWFLLSIGFVFGFLIGTSKLFRAIVYGIHCMFDSNYSDYHEPNDDDDD